MAAGIDSTGLNCYLVASGTTVITKANCVTAIAGGKRIGKMTTMGEIGGTRSVTETKYLSQDDSEKSMGSLSYGNLAVDVTFDPADVLGQADLRTMFGDKSARTMIIAETDGNYTTLPVKCSSAKKAYANDQFVMFKAVVEQNGAHTTVTA